MARPRKCGIFPSAKPGGEFEQRQDLADTIQTLKSLTSCIISFMNDPVLPGPLAVQQRVLPAYRAPFFDRLATACQGGLSVLAGQPAPGEAILAPEGLQIAGFIPLRNWHLARPDSPFYLCWQWGLLRGLERWQPEALIVEANPRYLSTPLAVRWMHARRRPVLGWGLGAPRGETPFRRLEWRRFLSQFEGLIAYSQRGADEYRALGFPSERVFVAPNAVMPRPAAPPPSRPAAFAGRPRVLFVGRLQRRKRVDLLLQACAALPPELQPEVTIVGDGPAQAELRALAQRLYPPAKFLGARTGAALEACFSEADVFVLPGTGGLAVQQAMAYALPVIVAQGDGTQDDLVRPQNGWRLPPGDLTALTETLQQALSDPVRLRRMGEASYRIVAEEANLERMVEVFVQALQTVSVIR